MPEIQMPKLSDTMTEGTLVAWKKKKGDKVSAGEVLAEIETDKATMEWESPEDGTLAEIYIEEGGKVNVGDKIAFIGSEGEEAPVEAEEKKTEEEPKTPEKREEKPKEAKAEKKEEEKAAAAKVEKKPLGETQKPAPKVEKVEETRVKASPVARRVAAELGIDLSSVKGTGPEGRVTETDVRAAAKSRSAAQ
jgi:pyruvate dehydrogenase E2 component (dihydrolipoamide acetyltransferase)